MKNIYNNMNIIGSDETGVGDYLTPLVVAAVYVPFEKVIELEKMGVTDSKKLSKKRINKLAKEIKPLVEYKIKYSTQTEYNKRNPHWNANELKMILHMKAINILEKKQNVDLIIIDQFAPENIFNRYYKKLLENSYFSSLEKFKTKVKLVKRGESEHVAVAAASIIARDHLLQLMNKQNEKWNTIFPLGASKEVEEFAYRFAKKHGFETLKQIAKWSFRTTKKIKEKLEWNS